MIIDNQLDRMRSFTCEHRMRELAAGCWREAGVKRVCERRLYIRGRDIILKLDTES